MDRPAPLASRSTDTKPKMKKMQRMVAAAILGPGDIVDEAELGAFHTPASQRIHHLTSLRGDVAGHDRHGDVYMNKNTSVVVNTAQTSVFEIPREVCAPIDTMVLWELSQQLASRHLLRFFFLELLTSLGCVTLSLYCKVFMRFANTTIPQQRKLLREDFLQDLNEIKVCSRVDDMQVGRLDPVVRQ